MTTSWKLNNEEMAPLNNKIRIVKDKEAVRILGAWLGNNTKAATPWGPVIDKIHKSLEHYSKGHPTLNGRKIIAQIIIGGYTQFLTQTQGMPENIERTLTKIIRDFIWEENVSLRIAINYLYYPVEEGSLNLLDIKTRNEAIETVWLKKYLNLSLSRPTWAKITDIIIDATALCRYNEKARVNAFFQTWNAPTRGPNAKKMSNEIIRMLKVAKEYKVNLAAIKLTPGQKKKLPAWFQVGVAHRPINNQAAKCLLNKHSVVTTADLIKMAARLNGNNTEQQHRPTNFCNCQECQRDHREGCIHPHDCAMEALARIHATTPKVNLLYPDDWKDNLSLTKRRKEQNKKAKEEDGTITFDPSLTSKDHILECFRIFTDPEKISTCPAQRLRNEDTDNRYEELKVFMDGACLNNGKANAKCRSRIWFENDDPRNQAIKVPGETQSNQAGEIAAALIALQEAPHFVPLNIVSDSKYVTKGLMEHLRNWED